MISKNKIVAIVLAASIVSVSVAAYFILKDDKAVFDEGLIIDFGDYTGEWASVSAFGMDGESVIRDACEEKGYEVIFADGKVVSVNGISSVDRTWDLWTWTSESGWNKTDKPSSTILSDKVYASLALTSAGKEPVLPCVDAQGNNIFSVTDSRIVSLSPSVTDTLCMTGNMGGLIGTDSFSNYPGLPESVKKSWSYYDNISPSTIVELDPKLVIGNVDDHGPLLNNIRESGIRSVSMYTAGTIEIIYQNTWMIGAVTGNIDEANNTILKMKATLEEIQAKSFAASGKTAVILFGDPPSSGYGWQWAVGCDTFIFDALSKVGIVNLLDGPEWKPWIDDLSEVSAAGTPDIVIFISSSVVAPGEIKDAIWDNGLEEWPYLGAKGSSDVWKDVKIYLLDGEMGEVFMLPGPRIFDVLKEMVENVTPI